MTTPLRLLHIEDNPDDTELVRLELRRAGYDVTALRVDTADSLRKALASDTWDAIICDHSLPRFTSSQALEIVQDAALDVPFIIVSGTIAEETAVEIMRAGAHDYLLKDNLSRLAPAIQREMHEAEGRRARKRAEAELRDRERTLARAQKIAALGIWEWNLQEGVLTWSDEMYAIFGMNPEEVPDPTERFFQAVDPGAWEEVQAAIRRAFDTGNSYSLEYRMRRPDGSVRWVHTLAEIERDATGRPVRIMGVATDVTERRNAEAHRRRLAAAVEQVAEGILITDRDDRILYVNPALEWMTGYRADELLGRTPAVFRSGRHGPEFYQQLHETLARGEVWRGHFTNRRKDGSLYEEDTVITPLRTAQGEITQYVTVKADVSERMQLEAQFRQAQKMEAVGTLAGGIAHDFNNLLTCILGNTELALRGVPADSDAATDLQEIHDAGQRAAELTRQLLSLSRKQAPLLGAVDTAELVDRTSRLLRRSIPEAIGIRTSVMEGIPPWAGDAGQLEHALLNLGINARDAMPDGGTLTFEAAVVYPDGHPPDPHAPVDGSARVVITVIDTGVGMPPEVVEHIFEPFYTTKDVGEGTGLGLAMVHGCIKAHGGTIEVDSKMGRGTTFRLSIPLRRPDETATAAPQVEDDTQVPRGTETVLLVDDLDPVRAVGETFLKRCGYKVLLATDGQEALDLVLADPGRINLIITDLEMPRIGGLGLLQDLRSRNIRTPVIAISGYASKQNVHDLQKQGFATFVPKPFGAAALATAVRQAIDA